jgi:ribonuclease Z
LTEGETRLFFECPLGTLSRLISPVLPAIAEMTFVAPVERVSVIQKFGRTHLDNLIERADRFENEAIIASHFSTRLHPDQIQRIIEKRLPELLQGRVKVWL